MAFLRERWALAQRELNDGGAVVSVPDWFFDEVTDRQLQRLEDDGWRISDLPAPITKGMASDLIGLVEPVPPDKQAVLEHFGLFTSDMGQSEARYRVADLMREPASAASWKGRPADGDQRRQLKFYGRRVARGLTHQEAEHALREAERELGEQGSSLPEQWQLLDYLEDEFSDKDMRELYGLEGRAPSRKAVQDAVESLLKEGQSLEAMTDDPELVAAEIMLMRFKSETGSPPQSPSDPGEEQ